MSNILMLDRAAGLLVVCYDRHTQIQPVFYIALLANSETHCLSKWKISSQVGMVATLK